MAIYYDSQNYITNNTPLDRLRGELGEYPVPGGFQKYKSNKITESSISPALEFSDKLFPTKSHTITLFGGEESFMDQTQWKEHIVSLVDTNAIYFDHAFANNTLENNDTFYNNFFHPEYEDSTKRLSTTSLLNYNILNLLGKSDEIKDMAALRSSFEENVQTNFETDAYLEDLMNNYSRRLQNYVYGPLQYNEKNRNIFLINRDRNVADTANYPFVLSFDCLLKEKSTSFIDTIEENYATKFLFQGIKNNLSTQLLPFKYRDSRYNLKTHDLLAILSNTDYNSFVEDPRELFLLNVGDQVGSSMRFMNQIRTVKLLQKMNELILTNLKSYDELIKGEACETFNFGFKIEKYIDNDVGLPVQTYYIRNTNNLLQFIDTQMKYGRKYFYKVYNLLCVFGSNYQYSGLAISNNDNELESLNGDVLENSYDPSVSYRAQLSVDINPSIQIIEEPIYQFQKMFFDNIPPKPIPTFHHTKESVLISLEPLIHSRREEAFIPLHQEEEYIQESMTLSRTTYLFENFTSLYFQGEYLIYRLDREPKNINEFYDSFLTSAKSESTFRSIDTKDKRNFVTYKDNSTHTTFKDNILPNKKYYYLFRTTTYHGTPSNYTDVFEVELLKTASDTKLVTRVFDIPKQVLETEKTKSFKRLLKIVPNLGQLSFPQNAEKVEDAINNMGILNKKLFSYGTENINDGHKFKIRITSKHTGKKIDLNVNFKIIVKTNYD